MAGLDAGDEPEDDDDLDADSDDDETRSRRRHEQWGLTTTREAELSPAGLRHPTFPGLAPDLPESTPNGAGFCIGFSKLGRVHPVLLQNGACVSHRHYKFEIETLVFLALFIGNEVAVHGHDGSPENCCGEIYISQKLAAARMPTAAREAEL